MGKALDILSDSVAPLMSITEYAKHRNVTVRAVQAAVKAGRIRRRPDGQIDCGSADSEWDALTDQAMRPGSASGPGLMASRSRKMAADAEIAEVRAAELRGELVSAAAAERMWFDLVRSARSRIMALPDLLAGRMSGMTRAQIRNLLDSELRTALADLPETMPVQQ